MIDIAEDLERQAARYAEDATAALEAEPSPLADLESARAHLVAELAECERRIGARRAAERRHRALLVVADELTALAGRHRDEQAPVAAGEAVAGAATGLDPLTTRPEEKQEDKTHGA